MEIDLHLFDIFRFYVAYVDLHLVSYSFLSQFLLSLLELKIANKTKRKLFKVNERNKKYSFFLFPMPKNPKIYGFVVQLVKFLNIFWHLIKTKHKIKRITDYSRKFIKKVEIIQGCTKEILRKLKTSCFLSILHTRFQIKSVSKLGMYKIVPTLTRIFL